MVPASSVLPEPCPVVLACIPGADGWKTWGKIWPKCWNPKFKKAQNYPPQKPSLLYPLPCHAHHRAWGFETQFSDRLGSVCKIPWYLGHFSCLNSSLCIHSMLNLTSTDSSTHAPYPLTCANTWELEWKWSIIHMCLGRVSCIPAVSSCRCELCFIMLWTGSKPTLMMKRQLLILTEIVCVQPAIVSHLHPPSPTFKPCANKYETKLPKLRVSKVWPSLHLSAIHTDTFKEHISSSDVVWYTVDWRNNELLMMNRSPTPQMNAVCIKNK